MVDYRRVRLHLDFPSLGILKRCWFLYDACSCRLVSDLTYKIAQRFGLKNACSLRLFVDEFLLPPGESVLVVRDNDFVSVKAAIDAPSEVSDANDLIEPNSKRFKPFHPVTSSSSSESSSSFLSSGEDEKSREAFLHCSTTGTSNCCGATVVVQRGSNESGLVRKVASEKKSQGFVLSNSAKANMSGSVAATLGPTQDKSAMKLKQNKTVSAGGGTHIRFQSTSSSSSISISTSSSSSSSETESECTGHNNQSQKSTPSVSLTAGKQGRGRGHPCGAFPRTVGGPRDKFETCSTLYVRTPQLDVLHRVGQQVRSRGNGHVIALRRGKTPRVVMRRTAVESTSSEVQPSSMTRIQAASSSSSSDNSIVDATAPLSPHPPLTVTNGSSQQQLADHPDFVPEILPAPMDFSALPDHNEAPNIGDKIAFKVLELSADYTPSLSNFKEGKVLSYRPSSQSVVVKLSGWCVHNEQQKAMKLAAGRFSLLDNSEDVVDVDSEVEVEFESMKSLKLVE